MLAGVQGCPYTSHGYCYSPPCPFSLPCPFLVHLQQERKREACVPSLAGVQVCPNVISWLLLLTCLPILSSLSFLSFLPSLAGVHVPARWSCVFLSVRTAHKFFYVCPDRVYSREGGGRLKSLSLVRVHIPSSPPSGLPFYSSRSYSSSDVSLFG